MMCAVKESELVGTSGVYAMNRPLASDSRFGVAALDVDSKNDSPHGKNDSDSERTAVL